VHFILVLDSFTKQVRMLVTVFCIYAIRKLWAEISLTIIFEMGFWDALDRVYAFRIVDYFPFLAYCSLVRKI